MRTVKFPSGDPSGTVSSQARSSDGLTCWYSIFLTQTTFTLLRSTSLSLSLSLHPFLFMSLIESAPLREWGTRYDSLSTSPSPSTTSSLSRNPPTTICTSTSTANSSLVVSVPVPPAKFHAQGDNVSHEASVFVGRYPHPSILTFVHALIIPFSVSPQMLTTQS
jgi:hypothetical protein